MRDWLRKDLTNVWGDSECEICKRGGQFSARRAG